jgi:hypothetical protein
MAPLPCAPPDSLEPPPGEIGEAGRRRFRSDVAETGSEHRARDPTAPALADRPCVTEVMLIMLSLDLRHPALVHALKPLPKPEPIHPLRIAIR